MIRGVSRRMRIAAALCITLCAGLLAGCMKNSSPVGSNLLGANERVVLHTLDSAIPQDSLSLSLRQLTLHIPTGASSNLLLGIAGPIESRVMLKFAFNVDSNFRTTVLPRRPLSSAYLQLKVGSYRFGDTSAAMTLAATVNEVLTPYELGATWDSLYAPSNYGPAFGTFSGSIGLHDSLLKIPVDTAFLTRLLSYKRFDSLNTDFHGLALLPQAGCTGVLALKVIGAEIHAVFKGDTAAADTVALSSIQHLYIANSTEVDPADRMIMQGGVVKRPFLTVSFPKLPKLSTVNSATLTLPFDPAGLRLGKDAFAQDSLKISFTDSLYMYFASTDSALGSYRAVGRRDSVRNVYVFTLLRDYIELWKHGAANHGMTLVQGINSVSDNVSTFDRFSFYPPTVADTNLRPRLRIVYTTLGQ